MKLIKVHFVTGEVQEMRVPDEDAEGLARTFNVDPNGTNRINAPDGTIVINRNHVTHVQIIPA
jgi:hypothetical protein